MELGFDSMAAVTEKSAEAAAPNNNTNSNTNTNTNHTVSSADNKDNIDSNVNNRTPDPKSESKEFNVQKLVDMFTKLNPLAKEFFPSSYHDQTKKTQFSVNTFEAAKQSGNENANFNANRRVITDTPFHSEFSFSFYKFQNHNSFYYWIISAALIWLSVCYLFCLQVCSS